ncbi:MAG TPA: hypothetical protein VIP11_17900 [Gemmatimonadaceae bacterium]
MDDRQLSDSDWVALRNAVPAFGARWRDLVAHPTYDETLPFLNLGEMARFVARELLTSRADVLPEIGRALEALYTEAAIRDDESVEGLLTVGFLENLLLEADELRIPLPRIEPMLHGWRTREHWDRAVTYLKPGYHWEDGIGLVATRPRPIPIGTVEIHRGWADRGARVLHLDARLVAGTLRAGCLIRHEVSNDFDTDWLISAASQRSRFLPDEYHLEITVERDEMFEAFELEMARHAFRQLATWEIARPRDVHSGRA